MAITKTTEVQRVETYPAMDSTAANTLSSAWPTLMVVYEDVLDDPEDAELPVRATRTKNLQKFTVTPGVDGAEDTSVATDVTGEAQLVQDICGAIWS